MSITFNKNITSERIYLTKFKCSDGQEFEHYDTEKFVSPTQEVIDYESSLHNTPDKTFNHGFEVGDLIYLSEDNKLYKAEVIKVNKAIHSTWIEFDLTEKDPYKRDGWHFHEPVWLDEIYYRILSTGEEGKVDGDFIKFKIKKSIEEFIVQ